MNQLTCSLLIAPTILWDPLERLLPDPKGIFEVATHPKLKKKKMGLAMEAQRHYATIRTLKIIIFYILESVLSGMILILCPSSRRAVPVGLDKIFQLSFREAGRRVNIMGLQPVLELLDVPGLIF